MKKFFLICLLAVTYFFGASYSAQAQNGDPFEGIYELLSREDRPAPNSPEYFLLDADTIGNIWAKYAEGPLPADLEKYRNEPGLLAGFTNRSLLFFTLERAALITPNFIAFDGGDGEKLELRKRADGKSDLAVLEKGVISVYLLGAQQALPSNKLSLLLNKGKID
jgi:hypothetical protein